MAPLDTSKDKASTATAGPDQGADAWANDRLERGGSTAGEHKVEATSSQSTQQSGDWKQDMHQALTDVKTLRELDGQTGQVFDGKQYQDVDALRLQLIESADKRFQSALPQVRENAQGADGRMFGKLLAVDDVSARKQDAMKELGLPAGSQLNGDQLTNAMLNAPDQTSLNKLSELASLNDMESLYKKQGGEAAVSRHLPSVLGLEYADFLSRYKNGVTAHAEQPGQVITAVDVLDQARNAESMADPRRQDVATRAGYQQEQNQNQVIANDKNPLGALRQAMASADPKEGQKLAEQGLELSKAIDPKDCQAKVADIKQQLAGASPDQAQALQAQMASWEQLSHAPGLANAYSGYFALQNGEHSKAADYLLKASSDPTAVASMTDGRGQPIYDTLLKTAMSGGKADLGETVGEIGKLMEEASKRGQAFETGTDGDQKAKDLQAAITAGEQAIQKASTIRQLSKDDAVKIDKQLEDLNKKPAGEQNEEDKAMIKHLADMKTQYSDISNYQGAAMMTVAAFDAAKGDANASKKLLDDLEKLDGDFLKDEGRKKSFDELREQTNSQLEEQKKHEEHENKNFFGKSVDNVKHWADNGWEWVKNNGKMVALGVGAAAAIGIGAVCSATGVGAVVGVPLMIAGGTLIGTAAGAGAEMAGKKKDNFGSAAWDVLPSAATGAVTGALTMGTGVAAAGGAGTAMEAGGVAANAGKAASMFQRLKTPMEGRMLFGDSQIAGKTLPSAVKRGALIAGSAGVPYNLGEVRDKAATGQYDGIGDAALDFARGEAMFTATGASAGLGAKAFVATSLGKNALFEATNPYGTNKSIGNYFSSVGVDTGTDLLTGGLGFGSKLAQTNVKGGLFQATVPMFDKSSRDGMHTALQPYLTEQPSVEEQALYDPNVAAPDAQPAPVAPNDAGSVGASDTTGSSAVENPEDPYAKYYNK